MGDNSVATTSAAALAPDLVEHTVHHVGFAVASITAAAPGFVATLCLTWDERIIHDPLQDVRVTFLRHRSPGLPMIELVEPASPGSHIARFVKRSGGLHHLCYETDCLERRLEAALASGALLVRGPTPAVAFDGRPIAWVCTRERLLLEFLQRA